MALLRILDRTRTPTFRASILVAASLAFVSMALLPGCVAAHEERVSASNPYSEDLRNWERESGRWMADFKRMAPLFSRELPQLKPDSAFSRHIAALAAFGARLDEAATDYGTLQADHARLEQTHNTLRVAYANMVRLAAKRSDPSKARPSPEIAEDTPH